MVPTSGEYSGTPDEYGLIYPWEIMVFLKIFSSKEFHIYIFFLFFFFTLPLKKSSVCVTNPWRIPFVLSQWWGVWILLTIIPQARMGSESIAYEAEGRMGCWLRGHEGEKNNCFSKIQLVSKK